MYNLINFLSQVFQLDDGMRLECIQERGPDGQPTYRSHVTAPSVGANASQQNTYRDTVISGESASPRLNKKQPLPSIPSMLEPFFNYCTSPKTNII